MTRGEEFEELRPLLFAIAYRILGSVAEAEDAVQETWRRYEASPTQPTLSIAVNLTTAPPAPFLPEEVQGKPIIAVLGVWSGRPEDGDAATRPFRELAPVVVDLFSPMPYVGMQTLLDPLYPRGMWNYFRSAFFTELDDVTTGAFLSAYSQAPNALSELHIHHLGGAMGRVPADATAFGTRDRDFILNAVARTPGAEGYDSMVEWARAATAAKYAISPDTFQVPATM